MSGILGAVNEGAGVVRGVSQVVGSAGTLAGDVAGLFKGNGVPGFGASGGYGLIGPGLGAWAQTLRPASFRGVGFAVKVTSIRRGRKIAVHEYAFRDEVWVEDLGRGIRRISFSAFLLGDNVFAQRDAIISAAETAGPGELVHPSLGSVQAVLEECSAGERADLGRVVEVELSFIQSGQNQPLYPSTDSSTQDATNTAANTADAASGSDFGAQVSGAIQTGAAAVQSGVATVEKWGATAMTLVGDASRVVGAVRGLAGVVGGGAYFGRYNNGGLSVAPILGTPLSSTLVGVARSEAAVGELLSASVTATTGVSSAAKSLASLAAAL